MDRRFTDQVPPISVPEAEIFVSEHFGIANTAHTLGSERDQNFRIEAKDGAAYLLKITHPGEELDNTTFQTACLRHVAAADTTLPVPRVLDDKTGHPYVRQSWHGAQRTCRLLTYLAGAPLHLGERDAAQRYRIGETLARLDTALATFPGPCPHLDSIWDMGNATSIRPLIGSLPDAEQRGMIEARVDAFQNRVLPRQTGLATQPIHNDFNPHNLLVSQQDHRQITGIIDFGDIAVAPRIYDLAVAASYQVLEGEHPLQTASQIVAGYHAVAPLNETEVALLHDLIPMRLALAVSITGWRAERHPANRDYILRNAPHAWRAMHQISHVSATEAEDYFHAANRRVAHTE